MKIPVACGLIDRRILVNFTVDPDVLAKQLPPPFRPQLAHDRAVAGVCLIRLAQLRPRGWPAMVGVSSENAAHRMAVEWDAAEGTQHGVYIPRRDTSSRLNVLTGGRIFPGEHHLADFTVVERDDELDVSLTSADGQTRLHVAGKVTEALPETSIFGDIDKASAFFERGSLGYSATRRPGRFDGLELRTFNWNVQPLQVTRVESSFFDDKRRFPPGSVSFDCALLMRGVSHEWHGREPLAASDAPC